MSQLYRQMEEDVAQKVRETMELAEARRRATSQYANDKFKQVKTHEFQKKNLERGDESIDGTVRSIEDIASELTETNDATASNVTRIGKSAAAKRRFLAKDIRNVALDKKKDLAEEENNLHETATFHIGFENIRDDVDRKQIRGAGKASNKELGGDSYVSYNRRELAQGALHLAQTASKDIDNRLYLADDAAKRTLAEGALHLAQNAARNINNRLYVTDNADQSQLPEGVLSLAQNAARNSDKIVNETANADKIESREGELNLALAEGALSLAQNAAWNIDNRIYETDEVESEMAERALHLAQTAAKVFDRVSIDVKRRELAEGALNLAQHAAKYIDKRPIEDVTKDLSFENVVGPEHQQDRKLQLGFAHFTNSFNDKSQKNASYSSDNKQLIDEIDRTNSKTLAEHDAVTVSAAEAKIRAVSEDLQNIEMDIDNNNYYDSAEADETQRRELAEGALNIAQIGARNISYQVSEAGDARIRELGRGALHLAQKAVDGKLSEGAERVEGASDHQKPAIQLGFDLFENTSKNKSRESDNAEQRASHLSDSSSLRSILKKNVADDSYNK